MDFSLFVSKKIRAKDGSNFSALISKIAIGSIAIGLAVMIVSFAIFEGFKDTIQDKIFSFTAHIKATKFDLSNSYEEIPVSVNYELYQKGSSIPGVEKVQVFSRKPGLLRTDEEVMGVTFKGISTDFDSTLFKENLVSGNYIHFPEDTYSKDIIISRKIANKLQLKTGDDVIMTFAMDPPRIRKLNVAGIYETGIEDFDNYIALGDIGLIQRLNNWGDTLVGGFEIFVDDFDKIDQTFDVVWDEMDFDLAIIKVTDEYIQFFDWFIMLNRNVYVFLFVILFVASFNVVSIILIMIMERTNMIGTLKALGASNWQVQKIFTFNGIRMILKGLILGDIIGIGFGLLQQQFRFVPLDPVNYYMDAVPIQFDWLGIVGLNILLAGLVSLILLIPTLIISRIEPIKSIKFN